MLRLNRVHKRNALDDDTILGLDAFFGAMPADIGAVLLCGEGDNFSAGLDLSELKERDVAQERFLPERLGDMYVIRTWVFFGDRERCRRFLSPHPLVKGRGMIPDEPVPVPDSIRAQRERLGFDFGKFDFVIHGEDGVLLAYRLPFLLKSYT